MSSNPYESTNADDNAHDEMAQTAKQVKVIGIALLMGCVSFLCIAVLVSGMSKEIFEGAGILSWIGVVIGASMFVMSMVIPAVLTKSRVGPGANHNVTTLCALFKSKSIVGMAMSEGGAFLNIVAYFIDGQLMNLGVVALLLLQIVMRIPTGHTVENFVSDQQRVLGQ